MTNTPAIISHLTSDMYFFFLTDTYIRKIFDYFHDIFLGLLKCNKQL